jgi:hypothetical protein
MAQEVCSCCYILRSQRSALTQTTVCGLREDINLAIEQNSTITPIDIAGTYSTQNGRTIDAKFELLRNSKSNSDSGREGVRAVLNGGRFPFDDKKEGRNQRAIIEFVCDKEKTGLEGDEKEGGDLEDDKDEDKKEKDDDKKEEKLRRREESSEDKCEKSDSSLRFCGYKTEEDGKDKVQTLRLEWRTKYACEDAPPVDGGSHWGFFGWFFIMYVYTYNIAFLLSTNNATASSSPLRPTSSLALGSTTTATAHAAGM